MGLALGVGLGLGWIGVRVGRLGVVVAVTRAVGLLGSDGEARCELLPSILSSGGPLPHAKTTSGASMHTKALNAMMANRLDLESSIVVGQYHLPQGHRVQRQ